MSDTLPLVEIPANTWVDLNTETGIAVGTAMIFKAQSTQTQIRLAISTAEPASPEIAFPISTGENTTTIGSGENRIWAYSTSQSKLSVQEG